MEVTRSVDEARRTETLDGFSNSDPRQQNVPRWSGFSAVASLQQATVADVERDIIYVCEFTPLTVLEKLTRHGEANDTLIGNLISLEDLSNEARMVSLGIRGAGGPFSDVEDMLQKLGPQGTAKAFASARASFVKHVGGTEDFPLPFNIENMEAEP